MKFKEKDIDVKKIYFKHSAFIYKFENKSKM